MHIPMSFQQELLFLLEEAKEQNFPIIVEGKNDKAALEKLGFSNLVLLHKKPLYKVVENLAEDLAKGRRTKEVVILTDLDQEGRRLFGKLSKECQLNGIKVNNKLRQGLLRTPLAHIEGLVTFLQNQEK